MKVYSVERCYDYEGCSIERIFSTREMADAYAEKQCLAFGYSLDGDHPFEVTEWTVDEDLQAPSPATTPKEEP